VLKAKRVNAFVLEERNHTFCDVNEEEQHGFDI
jgi:hypothetical protein